MAEKFQYPNGLVVPGTKYKVIRLLGAGGMGTVYEVEDTTIEKRYVLKTLHATLSSRKDLVERMQREAKALAKLEHRNIVQVITADATGDSLRLPYFVMQKLNGHTLRTVLDHKGKLEVDAAVRLVIDLLNALYHAHENGIIHRDVKPENIFLHRDPDGLTVPKLLAFGVMATTEAITVTGQRFIGTLRYAAPEQLLGEKVSAQTDLYAASLVLYECLAGRGPFDDEGEAMRIARAHIDKEAPPLSTFRQVPASLERIVMRSLAKSPEERHVDAFTIAAELHRFLRELRGSLPPAAANQASTVSDVIRLDGPPSSKRGAGAKTPVTAKQGPDKQPDNADKSDRKTPVRSGSGSDPTRLDRGFGSATVPASEKPTPRLLAEGAGHTPPDAAPDIVPRNDHDERDDRAAPAAPVPRHAAPNRGETIEDEAPPVMTIGEERQPLRAFEAAQRKEAAREKEEARRRAVIAAAPNVDRNATTGTLSKPLVRDGQTELIDSMVGEGLANAGTPPARNVKLASSASAEADAAQKPPAAGDNANASGESRRSSQPGAPKETSAAGGSSRTVSEAAAPPQRGRGERVFTIVMISIIVASLAGAAGFVLATKSQQPAVREQRAVPAASPPATSTSTSTSTSTPTPTSTSTPTPTPSASATPEATPSASVSAARAAPAVSAAPVTKTRARPKSGLDAEPVKPKVEETASPPRRKLPGSGL